MAINYYEPPEERDANREAIDELRGEVRALRAIILDCRDHFRAGRRCQDQAA